jgi:hypothetical protein
MKFSKYQQKKREVEKKKACELYKTGIPMRQVAEKIGKSHMWVFRTIHERGCG